MKQKIPALDRWIKETEQEIKKKKKEYKPAETCAGYDLQFV